VGLNPDTVYWIDVSNLLAITLKRNIENKGSLMGHTKIKKNERGRKRKSPK
jgi:hypothetical protein